MSENTTLNVNSDPYLRMKQAGFSDTEIRDFMRPKMEKAGFSDQEINGYFKGYDPVSLMDAIEYGFQGSVSGLVAREKLPDALTPVQVSSLTLPQRLGMQIGTLVGDLPTLTAGAALGTLGGPAAPATIPGAAMALTEGTRAIYMEQIKNGEVRSADEFIGRMGTVLEEAGKGAVIGASTGAAGKFAGVAAKTAGAGALATGTATVGAEIATMPTVSAGLEGRLPEPQEFVDAALLITGLKGAGGLGGKLVNMGSSLVPKMRGIYEKTAKKPLDVFADAEADPTIRQDILSINREVPERYAREMAEQPKAVTSGEMASSGGKTAIPSVERNTLNEKVIASSTYKLSKVIDKLSEDLGLEFRVGRLGPYAQEVQGIYKVNPEIARTRVANDITTIVHEAGHHIQKKVFGSFDNKPLEPFADELSPIASVPLKGQSNLPEGFAEFVARYVVNPQSAKESSPKFYDFFEEKMRRDAPDMYRILQDARRGVDEWNRQPAVMEVLSQINMGENKRGIIPESWKNAYTNFVDELHPLKKAVDELSGGADIPASINPYVLARVYRGAAGKATHFLERSPFKFNSGMNVGKSLKSILEPVQNLDELRAYLVAKRGIELERRGILSGIRKSAMEKTVESLRDKYEKTAQQLYEYQNHLMDYYADAGLLDAKTLAAMREANRNYVPFYRFMGEESGGTSGGRGFSAQQQVKRIKGSGRDILDPLESIVKNTYALIQAAEKNQIGKALADLAELSGKPYGSIIEKLPTKMKGTSVSSEDVMRVLKGADEKAAKAFADAVERGDLDVSVFRPDYRIDKRTEISVFRDGKREIYQVDPEIAKVINGLDGESMNTVTKLLSYPARWLRAGATLTPEFIVRNAARDSLSAFVQSEYGFVPGVDMARGLFHAIRRDDLYWKWKKSGGDQATMLGMDRTTVKKTLDDLTRTGVVSKTWNVVKNPVEMMRVLSELSEQANRLGEFARAEKQLGSSKSGLAQAALASREVSMDFARIGAKMRGLNAIIAFTNARIQGLDKMVRVFKEHPVRSTIRATAAITLPSVLLELANYGDERIDEIPRWQRDIFWLIPVGDVVYRIPKPFELGVIFGTIPERITEWTLDQMNEKERSTAFRGLDTTLFDFVKPPVLPTSLTPVIENWANKSFAFDRPIVPFAAEGILPEYQYTENTTELAKALSHIIGTLPGVGEMNTFSPAKAENFIRGYTGGSGMYALNAIDFVLRKAGALPDPIKPASTLADIPFVNAFVVRHPSMSAESIAQFREHWQEASSYMKTINRLEKEFRYDDIANLMPYNIFNTLQGSYEALSTIQRTIQQVNKVPTMTADEKRQTIDTLYYQAITIARYGNETYEKIKPMIKGLKERAEKVEKTAPPMELLGASFGGIVIPQ